MDSVLKWRAVKVQPQVPVQISVTGNVDTRVVTRYFWLPESDTVSVSKWDRNDGVALEFDVSMLVAGQNNHLGFSCRSAPVVSKERNLFLTFRVRQGNTILLEQSYAEESSDPNTAVPLNDGISLVV